MSRGLWRGRARSRGDQCVFPDQCPVLSGAPDHLCLHGVPRPPLGRALRSCMSHRLPVRAPQPRPGSNRPLKCTGGLNVLLIKLQARRSGSVGKRRDWGWDALILAPSRHGPSCGRHRGPVTSTQQRGLCRQPPGAAVSVEGPEGSGRLRTAVTIAATRPGALGCAQPAPPCRPEGVGEGPVIPSRWLEGKMTPRIALCCRGDISGSWEGVPEPPDMLGLNLEGKTEAHAPPAVMGMGWGPDPAPGRPGHPSHRLGSERTDLVLRVLRSYLVSQRMKHAWMSTQVCSVQLEAFPPLGPT